MNHINRVARKFELKLALGADKPSIDYAAIKSKATDELRKNIAHMASLVKKSQELREITFTLAADPLTEFGPSAQEGIKNSKAIMSGILYLDNEKESLSLEEMIKAILSISEAVFALSSSSGSDKWGIKRDKYLNALDVFGDYYTTQGGYGDRTKLNPMAKRALEAKFGKLTNVLDGIANSLRNPRGTGSLDLLKKMSAHGLVDSDALDKVLSKAPVLGDTSRVVMNLENHEKEQILVLFDKYLGITGLGLMPDVHTWNKYISPSPVTEKQLSDVFRAYLRAESAKARPLEPGELIGPNNKILSKTTVFKLREAAETIKENKKNKDAAEKLTSEKMFGSPEPSSKIKPQKDVRALVERLGTTERALWHKIPISIQIKILNNQIDLDGALEVAQEHSSQMVGSKLDASLFE